MPLEAARREAMSSLCICRVGVWEAGPCSTRQVPCQQCQATHPSTHPPTPRKWPKPERCLGAPLNSPLPLQDLGHALPLLTGSPAAAASTLLLELDPTLACQAALSGSEPHNPWRSPSDSPRAPARAPTADFLASVAASALQHRRLELAVRTCPSLQSSRTTGLPPSQVG